MGRTRGDLSGKFGPVPRHPIAGRPAIKSPLPPPHRTPTFAANRTLSRELILSSRCHVMGQRNMFSKREVCSTALFDQFSMCCRGGRRFFFLFRLDGRRQLLHYRVKVE